MKVIKSGTEYCDKCGAPLFDYFEFIGANGELDGDISHEYCSYEGNTCADCIATQEEENEAEE